MTLIADHPFNVITTIGGMVDGLGCYEVTNSTVLCRATAQPNNTATGGGGKAPKGNN